MDQSKYAVHASHCCANHGCKYGNEECPVVSGKIQQLYPCEDCQNEDLEFEYEARHILKDTVSLHYYLEKLMVHAQDNKVREALQAAIDKLV